ncbi:MAG: DNA alkylation response protein [Alphaproteobacteria bacterium]|jgi:putative acyl-CoA dehydrogenase|nr:DNA alkylation response protein [Alphaproteobacteria bacterium]
MTLLPRETLTTHDVTNQPPALGDADLWADDPALRDHARGGDGDALATYGRDWGSAVRREEGREANRHPPDLVLVDAGGRRLDELRFHPAYHDLLGAGLRAGYAATAWDGGSHVSHAAMVYMTSQVEPGVCCPMTMTYAAVPVLAGTDLAATWGAKLLRRDYDGRAVPLDGKPAATLGMAMTEKQGGSDVRANTTRAVPDGGAYRLRGHKWFCSAPMSDGFLTLAQAEGGLTCFLVPRWPEDGRNGIRITRLKDKLGNRANGSAEIDYEDALAWRIGGEGEGVRRIIEMVHHTRLDTALAPAGLMRGALVEAHHWVTHRSAFQKRLIDQPLMRRVLADLALDWEGALALGLRVARAFDGADEAARGFARIGVALAKFLGNKLCPNVTYEAMEVLGGIGYVEDGPMPLYYREAPLNSIWEGSGNVICLDVLRSLARDPGASAALEAEFTQVAGQDRRFDAAMAAHRDQWPGLPPEADARAFCENLASLLTASALMQQAPSAVAEGYIATRLGPRGRIAGAVSGLDEAAILARLGSGA